MKFPKHFWFKIIHFDLTPLYQALRSNMIVSCETDLKHLLFSFSQVAQSKIENWISTSHHASHRAEK